MPHNLPYPRSFGPGASEPVFYYVDFTQPTSPAWPNYITMKDTMRNYLALVVLSLPAAAQIYPQKVVTRYSLDDAAIPASLKWTAGEAVTASHGATWQRNAEGLIRHDSRAPERDRTQFFSGRRYLADNDVTALAPDASGGMWVRTRTGVSHIEYRPMTLADKAAIFEQRIRDR